MFDRELAFRHVKDTLTIAMEVDGSQAALIVADARCKLAQLLCEAYQAGLPTARVVLYDEMHPGVTRAAFDALGPGDLAVLVQSTIFRVPEFRIRVELFKRDVKVIEHANLDRMGEDEIEHYFAALAYDPAYYRTVGHALRARMDAAQSARIESCGETLRYDSPLEASKINIGDFAGLKNFGSQFPIGEVFTEARELEKVNGRATLYAFTDTSFLLNVPESPITIVVEAGRITHAENSTPEFDKVLSTIRKDEGEVWVRELGFGMNRGLSRDRRVSDVGAFERVCGVHLSLGSRHGVRTIAAFRTRDRRNGTRPDRPGRRT